MDDTFDGECIAGAKHHGGQRAVAQHLPLLLDRLKARGQRMPGKEGQAQCTSVVRLR